MQEFMFEAIKIAKKSGIDVPVGAVVVKDSKILASAHNERENSSDVSAHAEILAIKKASAVLNNWRLDDCELYVTLEPCPMCAWAILQSRINKVYFGSYDLQYGAMGSVLDLSKHSTSSPKIFGGILEKECDNVIKDFWAKRRESNIDKGV